MRAYVRTDARTYGRTLFKLIYHNTPIYAVDRQPLFCTFCARAQNVSKQSCHLGPSGPNGKIREKIETYLQSATTMPGGWAHAASQIVDMYQQIYSKNVTYHRRDLTDFFHVRSVI